MVSHSVRHLVPTWFPTPSSFTVQNASTQMLLLLKAALPALASSICIC
jgi:hypothetical protein